MSAILMVCPEPCPERIGTRIRRGGGSSWFKLIPGLNQSWHPWLLGGRAAGTATIGRETWRLSDAQVYGEKNWGSDGFPTMWWWGQVCRRPRPRATAQPPPRSPCRSEHADQAAERTPPQAHQRRLHHHRPRRDLQHLPTHHLPNPDTRRLEPRLHFRTAIGLLGRSATTAADASHDAELLPVALQPG